MKHCSGIIAGKQQIASATNDKFRFGNIATMTNNRLKFGNIIKLNKTTASGVYAECIVSGKAIALYIFHKKY